MSDSPKIQFSLGPNLESVSLGHLLCYLRLQKNWTEEQLAKKAGVSLSLVRRIERGHYPYRLRKKALEGFSHAFKFNFEVLYDQCFPRSSK